MSYPKKLLRLKPRRGVSSDLPAWSIGPEFFTQADNIVFRIGVAERAPSTAAIYDPPTVAQYGLLNTQIGGVNYWIYQGASTTYAVETTNHTVLTHAGGLTAAADASKISLGLLNSVPFLNNAADEPMYWDGNIANNFVTLPDWTATESCKVLVAHRFHLFALNISGPAGDFPEQVKWSDAAAPGNVPASWTATAANEAGDTVLSDTPGEIVTAANLRDELMIYKGGSTHAASYIGGEQIYAFRTVFSQAGALSRNAVADINGQHLVVTDGDIVLTDGATIRSIVKGRRKRFLFNQLDQDNYTKLFVVYYRAKNEVWVCFPQSGQSLCTRAMVYDIANDAWGDRELPGVSIGTTGIVNDTAPDDTWDADTDTWDSDLTVWNQQSYSLATKNLVFAEPATPAMLQAETGTESLTSTLARGALDFGEPERFKFVRRVHVRIGGATDIDFAVRIGTQQTTEGAVTWTAPQTMNSDTGFVNVLATGRFISVEIATTTTKTFKITAIDIEAELRGYH